MTYRITAADLQLWRFNRKVSQRWLADQIGVAPNTVSGWEQRGQVPAWLGLALLGLEHHNFDLARLPTAELLTRTTR